MLRRTSSWCNKLQKFSAKYFAFKKDLFLCLCSTYDLFNNVPRANNPGFQLYSVFKGDLTSDICVPASVFK